MNRWGVLLFLCLLGCRRSIPQSNHGRAVPENDHLEERGPETWTVDGKPTRIEGTYYMVLESGLQYTIEMPEAPRSRGTIEDEWWPLTREAFKSKRYLRSSVDYPGLGLTSANRIAVVFHPGLREDIEPFRYVLGLGDIQYKLDQVPAQGGSH